MAIPLRAPDVVFSGESDKPEALEAFEEASRRRRRASRFGEESSARPMRCCDWRPGGTGGLHHQ